MSSEILNRIQKCEGRLAALKPEDYRYSYTKDLLDNLKSMLPKKAVTLHKDTGPTCTSCE